MLTKEEHLIKLQKKVAKKIEKKFGISSDSGLTSARSLRYSTRVEEIHKLSEKVATKYCEKHGLDAPRVSDNFIKVLDSTFCGPVDGGSRYIIFNW